MTLLTAFRNNYSRATLEVAKDRIQQHLRLFHSTTESFRLELAKRKEQKLAAFNPDLQTELEKVQKLYFQNLTNFLELFQRRINLTEALFQEVDSTSTIPSFLEKMISFQPDFDEIKRSLEKLKEHKTILEKHIFWLCSSERP